MEWAIAAVIVCAIASATILRYRQVSPPSTPRGAAPELFDAVRKLETRIKALETEWDDTYEKLRRVDRRRGGLARQSAAKEDEEVAGDMVTRADVLRRFKRR